MKNLLLSTLLLFAISNLFAQSIDENNSVLLMKANVLYESGRYDEAVRMYNKILNNDESMTQALLMKAKAKYHLGAHKGTKNDLMSYIETDGVTKDVILWMAKNEQKMRNFTAATNSIMTAIEIDPYDPDLHLLAGDIANDNDQLGYACEMYEMAAAMGNKKAQYRIDDTCNGVIRTSTKAKAMPCDDTSDDSQDETTSKTNTTNTTNESPVIVPTNTTDNTPKKNDDGVVSLEDIVEEAQASERTQPQTQSNSEIDTEKTRPTTIDRDAVQSVEIDSKLYIDITDGLGARKLESKPSIFMLSDQDGIVVIDLCVDENGKVEDASFNRENSTIFRSSLTSLALRKARSFTFVKSTLPEQCGRLTFNIKA